MQYFFFQNSKTEPFFTFDSELSSEITLSVSFETILFNFSISFVF